MADGFHVPVIPLGDTVLSTGAEVPLQNVKVVGKLGTVALVTVIVTVSDTVAPQVLVAVNVSVIIPVAFVGIV